MILSGLDEVKLKWENSGFIFYMQVFGISNASATSLLLYKQFLKYQCKSATKRVIS